MRISQMADFFAAAGKMLTSTTREEGTFPKRVFVACFTYECGYAEFNGKDWKMTLAA